MINLLRIARFALLSVLIGFLLSGCIKAQLSIDVNANGSGVIGMSLGLTKEARSFLATQGNDPVALLAQALGEAPDQLKDFKVTRWSEGDYEWIKGEATFKNLDELNTRLAKNEYLSNFSLTRQGGFFKNRFLVSAQLNPLMLDTKTVGAPNLKVDPSQVIELKLALRLPGTLLNSNGVQDTASVSQVWLVSASNPVSVEATSEAWNTIPFIVGGIVLGVIILALVLWLVLRGRRTPESPITYDDLNPLG